MEIRMLQMILPEEAVLSLLFWNSFAFGATVLATAKLSPYLPKDAGREFAHDGKLSAGNPEAPELFLSWHLWHLFYCFRL